MSKQERNPMADFVYKLNYSKIPLTELFASQANHSALP